jgi:hypothetical protein
MSDNVRVVVRLRPLTDRELVEGTTPNCVQVFQNSSLLLDVKPEPKRFSFDYVGDETTSQEELFEVVGRPISTSCLNGYNGTIFAYGQTGAGKTFTIQGPDIDSDKTRGLLPRCCELIFQQIEETKGIEFLVRCSYLEIYQEQIIDLLNPDSRNLNLREDIQHGVYVEGLIEDTTTSYLETIKLLRTGTRNRHVSSTSMNMESSRSHSVFTMLIQSRVTHEGLANFKSSRFHLIDLAGSERQKLTDAAGERIKEASMINKSLSALGNVINSLVDISEGRTRHIHYRDSKLTFLLKDSLGGNSKTCIIAAISPAVMYFSETLSTLKFAQRAKQIKNRAVVNEDTSGTINTLKGEVKRLREEVARYKQVSELLCPQCSSDVLQESLEIKNSMHQSMQTDYFRDIAHSEVKSEEMKDLRVTSQGMVEIAPCVLKTPQLSAMLNHQLTAQCNLMTHSLNQTEASDQQVQEFLQRLQAVLEELLEALKQEEAKVSMLSSSLKQAESQRDLFKAQIKETMEELLVDQLETSSQGDNLKEVTRTKLTQLQEELNHVKHLWTEREQHKEDPKMCLRRLEEDKQALREANAMLVQDLEELSERMRMLAAKNTELLTQLQEEQATRSLVAMEISSAISLENLKEELLGAQDEIKHLREENRAKAAILQNTNRNILNTRAEIGMWKDFIDEHSHTTDDLREQIRLKTEELAACKEELKYYKDNRHLRLDDSRDNYLEVQNQRLVEELRERSEQVVRLHTQMQEARRLREGMDDLQVRKQIVKQYDENRVLSEGLTRIADYVFSLPITQLNPEETNLVESTIKGIRSIYRAYREAKGKR